MKNDISVLIVDDEEMMRNLLEKILSREGYKIRTAEDGLAALEMQREEPSDIIISDMKMPRMNGFELLKEIKKDFPKTGTIIMTAYGDTYTVKDALLLGADEYLTKPFKMNLEQIKSVFKTGNFVNVAKELEKFTTGNDF